MSKSLRGSRGGCTHSCSPPGPLGHPVPMGLGHVPCFLVSATLSITRTVVLVIKLCPEPLPPAHTEASLHTTVSAKRATLTTRWLHRPRGDAGFPCSHDRSKEIHLRDAEETTARGMPHGRLCWDAVFPRLLCQEAVSIGAIGCLLGSCGHPGTSPFVLHPPLCLTSHFF